MPYINEHAARLLKPVKGALYWSEGTSKPGLRLIIMNGKVQAIRFNKHRWTYKKAKKLLDDNNVKYIKFEKAKEER